MTIILMIIAIGLMLVGHIYKVKRWGLYINVYEKPVEGNLLGALAVGHVINTLIPIRIGDIFRMLISGRKMKNGYALSIATVLTDLYVDMVTVGVMCGGLLYIGKGGEKLQHVAYQYGIIFLIVIPATFICIICRRYIKKIIAACSKIFNETIEFNLMYISYLVIASLKDIIKQISKIKFVIYSIFMWLGYILAYVFFAEALQSKGLRYTTSEVFATLFSGGTVYKVNNGVDVIMWLLFLLLPLVICLFISKIRSKKNKVLVRRLILPQMSKSDKLAFLRTYYEEENREHINLYLEINKDVSVVEDNSAGSNASTVVILKDEKLYFRKYAFDADGEKLAEQIEWIEKHQIDIPLPYVVEKRIEKDFATYDMHSYASAVGLFRYIHTMPAEQGWKILENALDDIRNGLHTKNVRNGDLNTIKKYISSKVVKNLLIIKEKDKYITNLEKYDTILVNGKKLKTLKFYVDMLKEDHLIDIFTNDTYADIHGDLTIENIVCLANPEEIDITEYKEKVQPLNYYFIDPNTGNVHDSPFLDYAKLLQSLHGNYEFLMMVQNVIINKESVNYMMTKSEAYAYVYTEYKKYLQSKFSREEVLSIYYHEIIHWLRLMPYKIRKNEKLAVVFYTGLLQVLADVWEMENEK
jgi:hypothetical protein